MFIIFEGPDGAGKSTAVQETAMELWRRGRGTVLINQKRSPNLSAIEEYVEGLNFYRPGGWVDLILDRSWYSENVYGPIWRGKGLLDWELGTLESWAIRCGALVVLLDEPDEVLIERLRRRGDEDLKNPEEVTQYAAAYRNQSESWGVPVHRGPFDVETVVDRAAELASLAHSLTH